MPNPNNFLVFSKIFDGDKFTNPTHLLLKFNETIHDQLALSDDQALYVETNYCAE